MTNLSGIVLGYGATPLFVKEAADVPTMNWAWFIPAAVSMILTVSFEGSNLNVTTLQCIFVFQIVGMTRSYPPSPPSRSAEVEQKNMPYLKRSVFACLSYKIPFIYIFFFSSMKSLLTNKAFMVICLCVGGAVGKKTKDEINGIFHSLVSF